MPIRGPFARLLLGAGVLCAVVLALAGGVVLGASGVIAVVLAGAVAACLAAGLARETTGPERTPPLEAAVRAGAWTVGALMVVAGTAAVGGGMAAVLVGAAGAVGALLVWLLRGSRTVRPAADRTAPADPSGPALPPRPVATWLGHGTPVGPAGRPDAGGAARLTAPVSDLPTAALGREWVRTTAALAGWLEPAARESLVRRRQEALDELERRDPEGFASWLADGPQPGSDPAEYVRGNAAGGQTG
ncbi:hypothetical protein [Geodermatophilus sp. URMC 64]